MFFIGSLTVSAMVRGAGECKMAVYMWLWQAYEGPLSGLTQHELQQTAAPVYTTVNNSVKSYSTARITFTYYGDSGGLYTASPLVMCSLACVGNSSDPIYHQLPASRFTAEGCPVSLRYRYR